MSARKEQLPPPQSNKATPLALDALVDSWPRNFMRPRHRQVLRETPLGKWWHRERLTRQGNKQKRGAR
jgi:hypothetical protein